MRIEHITPDEATEIIETQQREGLFWLKDNGTYIGIDNTTRDAWVEEFRTFRQCERWLERR
jgi:hypothetical protein